MEDSNSALFQIMRSQGRGVAGHLSYLLLQKVDGGFIDSLIRSLDIPEDAAELDRYFDSD